MNAANRRAMERLIVRSLLTHMRAAGFVSFRVAVDFEQFEIATTDEQAIEHVFSVDESSLRFVPASVGNAFAAAVAVPKGSILKEARTLAIRRAGRACEQAEHGVLLIGGNGEDIISDWNYTEGDADGFSKAMDAFDTEELTARMFDAAPAMLAALRLAQAALNQSPRFTIPGLPKEHGDSYKVASIVDAAIRDALTKRPT